MVLIQIIVISLFMSDSGISPLKNEVVAAIALAGGVVVDSFQGKMMGNAIISYLVDANPIAACNRK